MATASQWNRKLADYAVADVPTSIIQLAVSVVLFGMLMAVSHVMSGLWWYLGLPFSAVGGVFLVKLFIIQHDCGHRSYFPSPRACDWTGRALSVLTVTPYEFWRRDHDLHHATSGDLDRRGHGDINTLTVSEYKSLGTWRRLAYRLYRHPITLFVIGPAYQFLLRYRIPAGVSGRKRKRLIGSILCNNLALGTFFGILCLALGATNVALVWVPAIVVAATIGVWLFYVQHQFETTYWERSADWSFVEAALRGCSFYRLPGWAHWATGYIGYHHIHHLSSRIPNYRLQQAFSDVPELREVRCIGIMESIRGTRLALWCEDRRELVTFRQAASP